MISVDIAIRGFSALLMIGLPIAVGWFWARRWGARWGVFFAGGVTFIASQVAHIPFNAVVLNPLITQFGWDPVGDIIGRYWVAIIFGLSAGAFEEAARYIVYRWWMKDVRQWREGVFFGLGHGGMEAIILGALAGLALYAALAFQSADFESLAPDQLQAVTLQFEAYWASPWYEVLLAVVERVFTLMVHVSLAVLVLQVFTRGNAWWLVLAVVWHGLVDAVAVFGLYTWGPYWTELAIGVLGVSSLAIVWWLRPNGTDRQHESSSPLEQPSADSFQKAMDGEETISDTRYARDFPAGVSEDE
jgi:uncharacterized membrane protein YhfC